MMINKKALISLVLVPLMLSSTYAEYPELECGVDPVFGANSCNQCFDGGEKTTGDTLGLLSDDWINTGDTDAVLYKEEQTMPEMINLDSTNVEWYQNPSEDFWEYPEEFNALYDEDEVGYVLSAGGQVTWLKSKLDSYYRLTKNTADKGQNIGLLAYDITVHQMVDGTPSVDGTEHRECVLFKSAESKQIVIPEGPTEEPNLPQTGPVEYILLIIVALLLGVGFMQIRRRV